jgi:hypothetical protein
MCAAPSDDAVTNLNFKRQRKMKSCASAVVAAAFCILSTTTQATVVYNTWSSNEAPNGNYQFTVNHNPIASTFSYNLTVSPWNAEALGIFIDLGNVSISGPVTLTNVSPSGQVALHAIETSSNGCGSGCNLNGLNPPVGGDGQWELVFRLGTTGFNGIQTFSWTTQDFGLDEDDFGMVGIRAQQLCTTGTLPTGSCNDSDKVYGFGQVSTTTTQQVSEPATFALLSFALAGLAGLRRKLA